MWRIDDSAPAAPVKLPNALARTPGVLTVALIEDESLASTRVKDLLSEIEDVRFAGEAASMAEGRRLLLEECPDVAIIDVELPDGSGIALAESLAADATPLLVFLTAFDRYAVSAFDVAAIDYLLKPVRRERLADALARARERLRPAPSAQPEVRPSRIVVTAKDNSVLLLNVADIDYIESAGNYVRLHWGGRHQLFRESIGALEARLDPQKFARTHRTVIVNLDRVARLEPNAFGDYRVTLAGGAVVPLSRRYRDRIPLLVGRL